MIYLDNSASTLIKPKNVQKAMLSAMSSFTANPGRSGHAQAIKTALEVEKVREIVANHVKTTPNNVIFTLNCTDALNLAILGSHIKGGHVVCTVNEHNSVLRPLWHLKEIDPDFSFSVTNQTDNLGIVWENIEEKLTEKTYMVVVNHISNVNGDVAEVIKIGEKLKEKNILFLVDGAQSGGHFVYNMPAMGIDMLALSPHKGFYGPQGVGCLTICGDVNLSPIRFGGTGTNSLELTQPTSSPERFESGTINTPAILGFGEGIKFVEQNFKAIQSKLEDLTTYLHYELSKLPVEIYTKTENTSGVFAFNIKGTNSTEISNFLDEKFGICIRSGYHCAPLKHSALKTLDRGIARVSMSYFNTYQEIEKLVFAIKSFLKIKNI